MKLFSHLYLKVMQWALHPHASRYLAGLSFAESSFFPIPPDVMLAPMTLANPDKAWNFAALTTIASVIGGLLGYLIGLFAFDFVEPLLQDGGSLPQVSGKAKAGLMSGVFGPFLLLVFLLSPTRYSPLTAGYINGTAAICPRLTDWAWCPLFLVAALMGLGGQEDGDGTKKIY